MVTPLQDYKFFNKGWIKYSTDVLKSKKDYRQLVGTLFTK